MRYFAGSLGCMALVGCLDEVTVEAGAAIECTENSQCPTDFVCRTATGLCVPSSGAAELVAAQVVAPSVEPTRARGGTRLRVTFSTDIDTIGDPSVTLVTDPPLVFEVVSETNGAFTYEALVPEFGDDGLFPVALDFVDINGNEVSSRIDDPLVTLDFTAPNFAAFVADNANPLTLGAAATVSFTASESLSSVSVSLPDGTQLAGPTVNGETLTFSGPVPAGTDDGPLDVTVRLVDDAGNEREATLAEVFTVDATPPTLVGTASPASAFARAGDLALFEFFVSEDLSTDPTVTLVGGGEPVPLDVQLLGNRVVASRIVSSGDIPNGEYTVRLAAFSDRAGNAGAALDLATLTVDAAAPVFVDPVTVPAIASRVAPQNVVTATFTLNEDVGTTAPGMQAVFGSEPMSCSSTPVSAAAFSYECTYTIPATGDLGASSAFVSVTAQDGAGNFTTERSTAVSLDFDAPEIIDRLVTRSDLLDSAIDADQRIYYVTETGDRPSLSFSFTLSEPVAGAYDSEGQPSAPPNVTGAAVTQDSGGLQNASFRYTFANSGATPCTPTEPGFCDLPLAVEVTDPAGNRVTLSLGTIRLDSTPPNVSPDNIAATTLYRAPWGNEVRDGESGAEGPLTNRLILDDGWRPEPEVDLFVLSGPDRLSALSLGFDLEPATGRDIALSSATGAESYITFRDRAGNFSPPVLLSHGLWVAGLKSIGSEPPPHEFGSFPRGGAGLPSPASLGPCVGGCNLFDNLIGGNTTNESVSGPSASWELVVEGPPPRRGATAAFDLETRQVLYVGGGGVVRSGPETALEFDANTWVYDGAGWAIAPGSIGDRSDAQAVSFDYANGGVRGGVLLFGGSSDIRPFSRDFPCSFHVFTGAGWTTVEDPSDCSSSGVVPGRVNFDMAYDPTGVAYILGGWTGEDSANDFWSVEVANDGSLDTQLLASGDSAPMNLLFPALAFDEMRGVLVAFGGLEGETPVGGLWEWDGNAWELKDTASTARFGAAGWYDPSLGGVAFAGGETDLDTFATVPEILLWDGTSLRVLYDDNSPSACADGDPCISIGSTSGGINELFAGQETVYDGAQSQSMTFGGRYLFNGLRPDALSESTPDPSIIAFSPEGTANPALVIRFDTAAQNLSAFDINRIEIRAESGGGVPGPNANPLDPSVPGASQLEIWNGSGWERLRFNNANADNTLEINCTIENGASCDGVSTFGDPNPYRVDDAVWLRFSLPAPDSDQEISVDFVNLRLDTTAR